MKEAVEDLFHGQAMEEEFLMTLASIGAVLIRQPQEAAIVMVLYQTGEILEDRAVDKTKDSIASLLDIQAPLAHLQREGGLVDVDPEKLKNGDQIEIRSGEWRPGLGKSPCAFAGDGLNDAPVIAAADVGVTLICVLHSLRLYEKKPKYVS